ncbi:unnamed protein product [Cercospora beticola]|nr:unnamed protein product [Cercospora beticola]
MKFFLAAAALLSMAFPFASAGRCRTSPNGVGSCAPGVGENGGRLQACAPNHPCKAMGSQCSFNMERDSSGWKAHC